MSNKFSKKTFIIVSGMALTLLVTAPAFADTIDSTVGSQISKKMGHHMNTNRSKIPGVFGTVASVSGNTITVNGKDSTTYSVDASSAKIIKDRNTTLAVSDIKIGDILMVKGKVTGTSILATVINDGAPASKTERQGKFPGVIGTVTSENGNIISVTSENGTVYTVDASTAKITKGSLNKKPSTVTISDIQAGDTVMVMGTVNGSSVVANKIFDGKIKARIMHNKNS